MTVGNLPSSQGRHQSSSVRIHTVITEQAIIQRAQKFQSATDEKKLDTFAQEKTTQAKGNSEDYESWKALLSLFRTNSREELITLFGFSKENVASQVAEAVAKVKASAAAAASKAEEDDMGTPHEPVVTFAEPETVHLEGTENSEAPHSGGVQASEATPSEFSTSATSDGTKAADIESTTTEHSLFADDLIAGTPQAEAAADFFSTMGPIPSALPSHLLVPHTNYTQDSSVAATIGSGPSSVASETLKNNNFSIYPAETSELDQLLTKALVLGDFESAVTLCISSNRFADAILLAVKGGEELLQKTQKAYFERQTASLPYLRLFQSIVSDDLEDIVQNADLQEWREIYVVLCTFAKKEEFSMLMEQLGHRLEFQGNLVKVSEIIDDPDVKAKEFKRHATLCYLAAQKLEKVVNIWVEEMCQEEEDLQHQEAVLSAKASRYTVHAQALQTFIEKVTVFRAATEYIDTDLNQSSSDAAAKTYKLASLYDRYIEYADLLASQGLVNEAVKYLEYTPVDYTGVPGMEFDVARKRLLKAAGKYEAPTPKVATVPAPSVAATSTYGQGQTYGAPYGTTYAPQQQQQQQQQPTQPPVSTASYGSYNPQVAARSSAVPASNPYVGQNAPTYQSQPYGTYGGSVSSNAYVPSTATYTQPASMAQTAQTAPLAPPAVSGPGSTTLPPPPQRIKRENGGWNDPPGIHNDRRSTPSLSANKVGPLTAPFPNSAPSAGPTTPISPYMQTTQAQPLPPPPRGGASTPQRGMPPPPPRGPSVPPGQGQVPPPVGVGLPGHPHPPQGQFIPPGRPGSGGPGQYAPPHAHARALSPLQGGPPARPMSGAPQFAGRPPAPASAAVGAAGMGMGMGRGTPPPPQMQNLAYAPPARATPPPSQQLHAQDGRPIGPGAPGIPGMQHHQPPPSHLAPSQAGPYVPPPGTISRPGPPGMQGPPSGLLGHPAPPLAAPPKPAPPRGPKYRACLSLFVCVVYLRTSLFFLSDSSW